MNLKVVCINRGEQSFITVGRKYEVVACISQRIFKEYWIINDMGSRFCYADRHFVTLKEYRRKKLERINRSSLIEPEL